MQHTTIREIEQFLYREARLLDNRQCHAWLDLLTDDMQYWMPVRTSHSVPNQKFWDLSYSS